MIMEERIPKIKNNNKKRIRLRVKDDRKKLQAQKIIQLRKRDRNLKLFLSTITFIMIACMLVSSFFKMRALQARRYEYNTLKADIVSYELQRDRLSRKLENAIDIKKIQRQALEDLGMVYRDKDNTVKLNVDRN